EGSGAQDDQDGTEDLVPVDVHVSGYTVEQEWADEEAVLVPVDDQAAAIDDERGARLDTAADVADDAVPGLRRDHGPHLGRFLAARADLHLPGPFAEPGHQGVTRLAPGADHGERPAA